MSNITEYTSDYKTVPQNPGFRERLKGFRGLRYEHKTVEIRFHSNFTGLFKKKYTLSKIYFTSTIEHMAKCYI
jgi:hypothetical protein